jgi:ATP-dependent Clp protease ATP-binding subunit ClpA
VRRLLRDLEKRPGCARLELTLDVSEEALEWLVERAFDPRNGVRYLRRTVEREVGTRVAEVLVRGEAVRGGLLQVRVEKGALHLAAARAGAAATRELSGLALNR